MAGLGSLAGLLAYGNANEIVCDMAREVLPVVKKTPVVAGVNGTDPFVTMDILDALLLPNAFGSIVRRIADPTGRFKLEFMWRFAHTTSHAAGVSAFFNHTQHLFQGAWIFASSERSRRRGIQSPSDLLGLKPLRDFDRSSSVAPSRF